MRYPPRMALLCRSLLLSILMLVLVGPGRVLAQSQAPQGAEVAAEPASDPLGPGGELDRNVRGGPPYGSREALRRSESEVMRRMRHAAADGNLPVAFLFFAGVGAVMPSSYDAALQTHAFGGSSPNVTVDAALTYRLSENFFLGGQIGARGHGWLRRDGASAMATGLDAMALLHLRFQIGSVFDLGAMVGAGAGAVGVQLYDSVSFAPSFRLSGSVLLGVRLATGFRVFVKGTWDYFSAFDLDRFGSDVDMGGPGFSLGFEVRS